MFRFVLRKFGLARAAVAASVGLPFLIVATSYAQVGVEAAPTATPASQAANAPATTGSGAPNTAQTGANQTQTNATGTQAEAERVIVTGSNIPTAEEVGPNPVLNINRDLINKSGERNAASLIKALPVANANGIPVSNNTTGFTPGASSISLRGFTPEATLVLIDGRRVAPYPIGANGTSSFIDLNAIPKAAIDSIEILKDGASTTYGADAVAGVVNIKLRHDYRGAESYVEYGNTLDKDASQFHGDVVFGIGDDKTQVTGVINYDHENAIYQRDRGGLSSKPPFVSSNSSPLNLSLSAAAVIAAGVDPATLPTNAMGIRPTFFGHSPFLGNGFAPATDYTYTAGRASGFNFNQFAQSFPESERWGGFTNFSHKWFGDQVVVYGDFFYEHAYTDVQLAPAATGSFQTAGQTTLYIPPNHVGATLGGPDAATLGAPADAFNPFNPFQQFISGGTRARLAEFGNRINNFTTDSFFATGGVKGDKLFDGNWGYDSAFRYSNVKDTTQSTLESSSRFNRILNANDPIFDPTSNQYIGTTVPYNPFGDYRVPIPTNDATVAFATVHPKDVDTSSLGTIDLNIYSTQLFKLPAGGVGFAVGGQFRRERLVQDPDQINLDGDTIGSSKTAITDAGRKDYGIYAELQVPIFSPENAIPGFHSVEVTGSARFEEFLNNDSNVLVPKVGLRWQPLDDSLTIRGTWGEGFLEPSLFQLYSSPTSGLTPTSVDPETPTITTSNRNLQPEDSRSLSTGIVYTPKFVPGLTLSVDIWGIERKGVVTPPITQQVFLRGLTGHLLPGEMVVFNADGTLSSITDAYQNSGQQRARGIDLGLQYQYQSPFGTFTTLTQATYLDSFVLQATTLNRAIEVSNGSIGGMNPDGFLKWKAVSRLDWAWNGIDINTTARYTAGFHEKTVGSAEGKTEAFKEHWIDSTVYFDLQGSYDFTFVAPVESQPVAGYSKDSKEVVRGKDGKAVETAASQTAAAGLPLWKQVLNNTTITVGCDDVLGQDPPLALGFALTNPTGYPGFVYDNVGRFVYVSLTKKF